jgi:hypothetical protein
MRTAKSGGRAGGTRGALLRARAAAGRLTERAERAPGHYRRWLPPQWAFLQAREKRVLLRAGNQVYGKTTAGLAKVVDFVEGRGVWTARSHAGPVECWIVTASWSQSIAIQAKLWDEIDKSKVDPETVFDSVKGFRGKNPAVQFRDGSIIRIKTTAQGGLALAGATIDAVLFDEPPSSARVYGEVQKRVLSRGGYVWLTLTPINAPVAWLAEAVEKGLIVDLHYPLRPEFLIPVGAAEPFQLQDGTVCDAAWIERVRRETLAHEVPVVVDGEWECRVLGRVFTAFQAAGHVAIPKLAGRWKVCLGIDHGSKIGKQTAYLIAVDDSAGGWPRVAVLEEYAGAENCSSEDDARAILAMLSRHGLSWKQLNSAWGDRLYIRGAESKSNAQLMLELAKLLKLSDPRQLQPRVRTVKKGAGRGAGSVDAGCRWLHQLLVRPGHLLISPACPLLIEAFQKWDGRDDGYKDHLDALRYGLQDWIFGRRVEAPAPVMRLAR